MEHEPALYHRLGQDCATRYTDYRIAYYRLPIFPERTDVHLISGLESERGAYLQYRDYPPEFILDPADNFGYLQAHYPGLFDHYKAEDAGRYRIYRPARLSAVETGGRQ
jgi:hypothetical protein